jgi:hypothetical protein
MATDHHPRILLAFVLFESSLMGLLAVGLVRGFLGPSGTFGGLSTLARAAVLLALLVEFAIPLAVYVDVARRDDDPDWVWVHAATMPVVNLLGLVAYLDDRKRSRE